MALYSSLGDLLRDSNHAFRKYVYSVSAGFVKSLFAYIQPHGKSSLQAYLVVHPTSYNVVRLPEMNLNL